MKYTVDLKEKTIIVQNYTEEFYYQKKALEKVYKAKGFTIVNTTAESQSQLDALKGYIKASPSTFTTSPSGLGRSTTGDSISGNLDMTQYHMTTIYGAYVTDPMPKYTLEDSNTGIDIEL